MTVGRDFSSNRITMMLLTVLFLLGLVNFSCQEEQIPRTRIPLGNIKGYYKVSYSGRTYEAYEGVPYAASPTGDLRFRPPQLVESWAGELSAVKRKPDCLQYANTSFVNNLSSDEDCLYTNIYVKNRASTKSRDTLLPVMVWFHGGAFQFGSANQVEEKYMMDRDIVLVTVNYRLGPFGFLSTEDEVLPGNMGMKDQSMALRWVSENIKYFGGDPKKVTIFGMSAGGASVHYHYLSPLSAGLFQRGISISGTAFDPWAQTVGASEKAKQLGNAVGCPTTSTTEMIDCLRTRPARDIIETADIFAYWQIVPFTPFGPVVEKHGSEPFLDSSPVEIINSGRVQDVPWITGAVQDEGLYPAGAFIGHEKYLKELDDNWGEIAPYLLNYNHTIPPEDYVEVAEKVREHYLQTRSISSETIHPLVQMVGDRLFVYESEKAARMQAAVNRSPVWYYYYTYTIEKSLTNLLSSSHTNFGVSHGDDIFLVLGDYSSANLTSEERDVQRRLIDFYVSFATDGVPQIGEEKWRTLDPNDEELRYLHIADANNIKMDGNSNFGEKDFWSTINFNENVLPS